MGLRVDLGSMRAVLGSENLRPKRGPNSLGGGMDVKKSKRGPTVWLDYTTLMLKLFALIEFHHFELHLIVSSETDSGRLSPASISHILSSFG